MRALMEYDMAESLTFEQFTFMGQWDYRNPELRSIEVCCCCYCFGFFWHIVDLQCVNFCCTAKWFCLYIYILFYTLFHCGLSQNIDTQFAVLCYLSLPWLLSAIVSWLASSICLDKAVGDPDPACRLPLVGVGLKIFLPPGWSRWGLTDVPVTLAMKTANEFGTRVYMRVCVFKIIKLVQLSNIICVVCECPVA